MVRTVCPLCSIKPSEFQFYRHIQRHFEEARQEMMILRDRVREEAILHHILSAHEGLWEYCLDWQCKNTRDFLSSREEKYK